MILFRLSAFSQNQFVLRLDFNDRMHNTPQETQEGFQPFVLDGGAGDQIQTTPTIRKFGKLTVKVEGTGDLIVDDRWRDKPVDSGSLTESALLRDFIFAKTNSGLMVTIEGLAPNTEFEVSIWSYDCMSKGTRVSRWFANQETVANDHCFSGESVPKKDSTCRLDFGVTSTAAGEIILNGETEPQSLNENGKRDYGVFLNALQIARVKNENESSAAGK
jgi:hypothetical protein